MNIPVKGRLMMVSSYVTRIAKIILAYKEPHWLDSESKRIFSRLKSHKDYKDKKDAITAFLSKKENINPDEAAIPIVKQLAKEIHEYAHDQMMSLGDKRRELFGLPSGSEKVQLKLELLMKDRIQDMVEGKMPPKPAEHIFEITGKKPTKEELELAVYEGVK